MVAIVALAVSIVSPVSPANAALAGETISVDGFVRDVAVDPSLGQAYAIDATNNVIKVLDGHTHTFVANIPVREDPLVIAVNPATHRVYVVSNQLYPVLTVIDGVTRRVVDRVYGIGGAVASIAVDPVAGILYLVRPYTTLNSKGVLVAYSESDLSTPLGYTTLQPGSRRVAVDPVEQQVWVTNIGNGTVSVLDQQTLAVVDTVAVGTRPIGIAIDPVSRRAFVVNWTGAGYNADTDLSTVSVINLDTHAVLRTVTVGLASTSVAVNPASGMVYVPSGKGQYDGESFSTLAVFPVNGATVARTERVVTFADEIAVDTATGTVYINMAGAPPRMSILPGEVVARPSRTPSVSGTPVVGATLTAKSTGWVNGITLGYSWNVGGVVVPGATSSTYVVRQADFGKRITVDVTASLLGFRPLVLTSTPTAAVAAAAFPTKPRPVIAGTARVGAVLTATPGTWTGDASFTYRWYRAGKAIRGASASTYAVVAADRGKRLTVRVTARATGYLTATTTSAATKAVTAGVLRPGILTIVGETTVGQKLTAHLVDATPGATAKFQWYADGRAIPRATSSTLTLTAAQRGRVVTVKATLTKAGYTRAVVASVGSGPVT